MDNQKGRTDWRSILLLIFILAGVVILIGAAVSVVVMSMMQFASPFEPNPSPGPIALSINTLVLSAFLLLPAGYYGWRQLRGAAPLGLTLRPPRPWQWIALPSLWGLVIALAVVFYDSPSIAWFAPVLHTLGIAIPVYMLARIGAGHIPLGSKKRAWGIFSLGLVLSPFLSIVIELLLVLFAALIVSLYLAFFDPTLFATLASLAEQIQQTPDLENLLALVGPFLQNPLALVGSLFFLSIAAPLIEESMKSIGLWLVSDRLQSTAQGFALGMLSGAGFALIEGLSATQSPDADWAIGMAARSASSLMHMLASGFVGWGIARARLEKRYLWLGGAYLAGMALHAAWNGGAVFAVFGSVNIMLSMPDIHWPGMFMVLGGAGLLLLLLTGMFALLVLLNAKLRASIQPPPNLLELEDETQSDRRGGVQ